MKSLPDNGQKAWIYDEFDNFLHGMVRNNGVMNDFDGFLRIIDDTNDRYEYATHRWGKQTIVYPYLSMLSLVTFDGLSLYAKKGSSLWRNGFLARFLFIAPPLDFGNNERFPDGEMIIPPSILSPLKRWDSSLGIPDIEAKNSDGRRSKFPETSLGVSTEVLDAVYAYDAELRNIIKTFNNDDLNSNYVRFPEKALRIAALFASIGKSPVITIEHFSKALGIIENMRKELHDVYILIKKEPGNTRELIEDRVFREINKGDCPDARTIEQNTKLLKSAVEPAIESLLAANRINSFDEGCRTRYSPGGVLR